jgi:hypothetical protein
MGQLELAERLADCELIGCQAPTNVNLNSSVSIIHRAMYVKVCLALLLLFLE